MLIGMENDHNIRIHVEGTEEAAQGISRLSAVLIPLIIVVILSSLVALVVHIIEFPGEVSVANIGTQHEVNQIKREEAAQQRADNRVGAAVLPKAPISLTLVNKAGCIKLESGYLDNGEFTGYVKNSCHQDVDYYQLWMSGAAPDGTTVQTDYENTADLPKLGEGDRAEIHVHMGGYGGTLDDRIVSIKVIIKGAD